MRVPIVLLALGAVSGCGQRIADEAPEVGAAKEAVQALLTDPASAQFRTLKVNSTQGGPATVCGEVNAKNRVGGYNGFGRFYYVIATKEAATDPLMAGETIDIYSDPVRAKGAIEFDSRYAENCIGVGMPSIDESNVRRAKAEASLKAIEGK